MEKTKFKIGDRVKIKYPGDKSHGKIGTIVKYRGYSWWTVKIPGFDGHAGDIKDGTFDKWFVSELYLTKLPEENESMKIEVKKTKKGKEITYPCFREANNFPGLVVLFFSENVGIIVDNVSSPYQIVGEFGDYWNPDIFSAPLNNYSATIFSNP